MFCTWISNSEGPRKNMSFGVATGCDGQAAGSALRPLGTHCTERCASRELAFVPMYSFHGWRLIHSARQYHQTPHTYFTLAEAFIGSRASQRPHHLPRLGNFLAVRTQASQIPYSPLECRRAIVPGPMRCMWGP